MKAGWLSSTLGKTILYTVCTDFFRDSAGFDEEGAVETTKVLHNLATFNQLASIEAATLSAPTGMHDDRADSYALAQVGREQLSKLGHSAGLVIATTKGW